MADPCIVVIASPDLLPSITQRTGATNGEVLTFTDAEALKPNIEVEMLPVSMVPIEEFRSKPRYLGITMSSCRW